MFGLFVIAALLGLVAMLWLGIETKNKLLEELSH
jgi:hypothetical protein